MAGYRQIHTQIWSDNWFSELEPELKLLFIYLFGNSRASVCGLFELSIKIITFETGLPKETVLRGVEIFIAENKIAYDYGKGVIWIKNMSKYQASSSPKVKTRIETDIKLCPDCAVKDEFIKSFDTVPIPYNEFEKTIDTSISIKSLSIDQSIDSLIKESSENQKSKSPSDAEFFSHFGNYNNQREQKRWIAMVESVGFEQAQRIADWAEKKEIHFTNRGGLLDSMETAAKNWKQGQSKPGKKDSNEDFFAKLNKLRVPEVVDGNTQ